MWNKKGVIESTALDIEAKRIETDATSVMKAQQLKTQTSESWTNHGMIDAEDWVDTSDHAVTITNSGTAVSRQTTDLGAQFLNGATGKADLTRLSVPNVPNQPFHNDGTMTLRQVKSLGSGSLPVTNGASGKLVFLDSGTGENRLHMGAVTNLGTIGFGRGGYRINGTFANKGTYEALEGSVRMNDLINDGAIKALHGCRLIQKDGLFTKIGKVIVKGGLTTQTNEQAVKDTGGIWTHTGDFDADEWIDESDSSVKIKNTGTIISRNKTTVAGQFENAERGVADLKGVSFNNHQDQSSPLSNQGTLTLRDARSIGGPQRDVLNSGTLRFLDCGYSQIYGDSSTGGLTLGDVTNYGTIGFGGGSYYTGIFTNHKTHEALDGQNLWMKDFINNGVTQSTKGYIIDMTRGTFTKLGKVATGDGGNLTLKVSAARDIASVLFQEGNEFTVGKGGKLVLEGNTLTVPFSTWEFTCPISLHLAGLLRVDGIWLTGGLDGTVGGLQVGQNDSQLGALYVNGDANVVVNGVTDNRFGRIEITGTGKIASQGNILVGNAPEGYKRLNGAYILAHQGLELETPYEILNQCGEIASEGPMTLRAGMRVYNHSGRIRSQESMRLQTPLLQNHTAAVTFAHRAPCDSGYQIFFIDYMYHAKTNYRAGGDQSDIYSARDFYLDVCAIENLGARIHAFGTIKNTQNKDVDCSNPEAFFTRFTQQNYCYDNHCRVGFYTNGLIAHFNACGWFNEGGGNQGWQEHQCNTDPVNQPASITTASSIIFDFVHMFMSGGVLSGTNVILKGKTLHMSGNAPTTAPPPVTEIMTSLAPYLVQAMGASLKYRSRQESPFVAVSSAMGGAEPVPFESMTFVENDLMPAGFKDLLRSLSQSPQKSMGAPEPLSDRSLANAALFRQLMGMNQAAMAYSSFMNQHHHRGGAFKGETGKDQMLDALDRTRNHFGGRRVITQEEAKTASDHTMPFVLKLFNDEVLVVPHITKPLGCDQARAQKVSQACTGVWATGGDVDANMTDGISVQGNVTLAAERNITTDSKVTRIEADAQRQGYADNYQDSAIKPTLDAGNDIDVHSDNVTYLKAVDTQSGRNTSFSGDGAGVIDDALALDGNAKTYHKGAHTETHTVKHAVSTHKAGGAFSMTAMNGAVDIHAHKVAAKSAVLTGAAGVTVHDVHNTVSQKTTTTEKKRGGFLGLFSSSRTVQSQSFSSQSVGAEYDLQEPMLVQSGGHITATNVTFRVPRVILKAPMIQLLAGVNTASSSSVKKLSNLFWQSMVQTSDHHQTYSPCQFSGDVETHCEQVVVDKIRGTTLEWMQRLELNGGRLTERDLEEIHRYQYCKVQGPTQALAAVIALAVTIGTAGAGGSIGGALATNMGMSVGTGTAATLTTTGLVVQGVAAATFTSLCSQAALSLASCNGDLGRAAKSLASSDTLKSISLSAATAGITKGIGIGLKLPTTTAEANKLGVMGHFQHQVLNASVGMGAAVLTGHNAGNALRHAGLSAAINTAGAVGANHIGAAYQADILNSVTHKLAHAGLGALAGAALNPKDPKSGATAGAMGAFVAETFADVFSPDKPMSKIRELEAQKGRKLTSAEFTDQYQSSLELYEKQVGDTANWSKVIAATTVLLAGQDVTTAIHTATNAVDNNFAVLAYYGIVAAGVAYSAYEVYDAYETGGPEAALRQLGIEIATDIVGGAVLRVGGKLAYKVGSVVYPGIEAAVSAALDATPGLKLVLGGLVDKLVVGAERIGQSALGQGVAKFEASILSTENKVVQKFGFGGKSSAGVVDDVAEDTAKSIVHGPLNPGPLVADVANTFRSGTYTTKTLSSDAILYRITSETGNPLGSYWTSVEPKGSLQSVIDSALDQNWGNTATRIYKANIPAGTTIYEGSAAAQRGLVGGGNQIYIPKVDSSWLIH